MLPCPLSGFFCPAPTKLALDLQVESRFYQLRADHFTCLIAPVAKMWQVINSLSGSGRADHFSIIARTLYRTVQMYSCSCFAWFSLRIRIFLSLVECILNQAHLLLSECEYCFCFRLRINCLITSCWPNVAQISSRFREKLDFQNWSKAGFWCCRLLKVKVER